ncbi:hypothetical protein HG530_009455 [Fusarium avenaceum]|nr:hypothetical protein HG530_009455 [Fusarium avenaceum]
MGLGGCSAGGILVLVVLVVFVVIILIIIHSLLWLPVKRIDISIDRATTKGNKIISFTVAVDVCIAHRALGADTGSDCAHESFCRTSIVLDNVIGFTIASEIGESDLAACFSNTSCHNFSLTPDSLPILWRDILVVEPALDSSTVIKNEEVVITVSVQISKADLTAWFSNTRRNGDGILPVAGARGEDVLGVQVFVQAWGDLTDWIKRRALINPSTGPTLCINRDDIVFAVTIQVCKSHAGTLGTDDTQVLPHTDASVVGNSKEIGEAIAVHIRETYHLASDARDAWRDSTNIVPIAAAASATDGIAESLDGTAIVDDKLTSFSVSIKVANPRTIGRYACWARRDSHRRLPVLLATVFAIIVCITSPLHAAARIHNDIISIAIAINILEVDVLPGRQTRRPIGIKGCEGLSVDDQIGLAVVVNIRHADHITFDRRPTRVDLSKACPGVRLASVDPRPDCAVVIGEDIISDTITVEVGQYQFVAAPILGRCSNGTYNRCGKDGDPRDFLENTVNNIPVNIEGDVKIDILIHVVCASMDKNDIGTGFDRELPVSVDISKILSTMALVVVISHATVCKTADHVDAEVTVGMIQKLLAKWSSVPNDATGSATFGDRISKRHDSKVWEGSDQHHRIE